MRLQRNFLSRYLRFFYSLSFQLFIFFYSYWRKNEEVERKNMITGNLKKEKYCETHWKGRKFKKFNLLNEKIFECLQWIDLSHVYHTQENHRNKENRIDDSSLVGQFCFLLHAFVELIFAIACDVYSTSCLSTFWKVSVVSTHRDVLSGQAVQLSWFLLTRARYKICVCCSHHQKYWKSWFFIYSTFFLLLTCFRLFFPLLHK